MKNKNISKRDNYTEISMRFYGERSKLQDIIVYLKLKHLSRNLKYPDFIVDSETLSYGQFLRYNCRSVLGKSKENDDKIKTIGDELIRYGIKNRTIPIIEIIGHGKQTQVLTLEDYLKSKGIGLEELYIEIEQEER